MEVNPEADKYIQNLVLTLSNSENDNKKQDKYSKWIQKQEKYKQERQNYIMLVEVPDTTQRIYIYISFIFKFEI